MRSAGADLVPAGLGAGSGAKRPAGYRAAPLFEDIRDVLAAVSLEDQGVLEGTIDFCRAVDFAQSDDFLDVVKGVESLVFQLARIRLGVRTEGQEGQE